MNESAWLILIRKHDEVWNDGAMHLSDRVYICGILHRASIYVAAAK